MILALVIFETIADFGGVSALSVETFTVGIYKAWYGYETYSSAARLAGYLLIFVFFIIFPISVIPFAYEMGCIH